MFKTYPIKSTAFKPELIFWVLALLMLFFIQPGNDAHSLCVFKFLHFPFCPGCGIGRAIHYAMMLDFSSSWHNHYFGIPALLIILHRIYSLLRK
ncbi:MAG: DUF2752 domain-containing protein [Bacteroidetes bacterium]|nr:DUF2752 domain-containing protein [Bacteroidota bacterium]MBS1925818.1 DUF2752 domain-containing protein [Bacteroidota bacterium]MCC6693063.1 DUF2752 domain-containing protein [Chitinophagaceae bacterium]